MLRHVCCLVLLLSTACLGDYFRLWIAISRWTVPVDSDNTPQPYLMRAASAVHVPAALTTNWVFAIDGATNSLYAVTWRDRAATRWASTPIPGLNASLPVLSVEAGPFPSDSVYLLDLGSGHLHAYAPATGPDPIWVSDFVCSQAGGAQHQWLGASAAAGVVVARCSQGLAVVDLKTGHLKFIIKGRTLPLTAPVPFLSSSTVGTWRGGSVVASSLTKGGIVPWSYTHPNPAARITSVAPSASGVVAVTVNGTNATNTLTLLSTQGKLLSTFTLNPDTTNGLTSLSILPTPTIHKGVLYGIATVLRPDPLDIALPAHMWFTFAVDVRDPRNPTLLWQNAPETGEPLAQKVQLSKRMVFASIHGHNFEYRAWVQETGEFSWDSTPFPVAFQSWDENPTMVVPTYCCEGVVISRQSYTETDPNYTTWAYQILDQRQVPIPLADNCFCDE